MNKSMWLTVKQIERNISASLRLQYMLFDVRFLCDISVFRSVHLERGSAVVAGRCSPKKKRHSRKEMKLVRKKRWRRVGRGKDEIRSGPTPAFAFKLLYNCILRGTKSDGDLRDVITDERLYKKLPILSSLPSRSGERYSIPTSLRISHFLLFVLPHALLSLLRAPSSKKLVFAVSRSGGWKSK